MSTTVARPYQAKFEAELYGAWDNGARNVMGTMATGGGKSVVICNVLRRHDAPSLVMAHRSELVSQLALTLNREGIPHAIIAPDPIIRQVIALEVETHGRSYYSPRAVVRVASAHTLAVRRDRVDRWYNQCSLAVVDEGHHVTLGSIWDRALSLVPNARVLSKTAHAVRADGKGLGRPTKAHPNRDGIIDALVVGPFGRNLIDMGYLCDYQIACPPSDVQVKDEWIGPSGEFNQKKTSEAVHGSKTRVGDIVGHYCRRAGGKLGLTFATDIKDAHELRAAYEKAGVPAEVITADTPIPVRAAVMRRFRARQLLQLVSVDVLSEGVDVPAVEVVSLGRHTASWQLYCQQVGRALRPSPGKTHALILDHVGNFHRHYAIRGTFDSPQQYSLDRRESRGRSKQSDAIPMRTCLNELCFFPYPAYLLACPRCGEARPTPAGRATPEQVDGDLQLLDFETLRTLRNELLSVDAQPSIPANVGGVVANSIKKQHMTRQIGQGMLRPTIALWAGWQRAQGLADREIQRLFFHRFGVDVMTAQTLGINQAEDLRTRLQTQLDAAGVVTK